MRTTCRKLGLALCLGMAIGLAAIAGPLEDYVRLDDGDYAYKPVGGTKGLNCTVYVLDMTSQSWRIGDVDKPQWRHWVTIIKPDEVKHDTALLVVAGGNNKHDKPPANDSREAQAVTEIAKRTNSVAVVLQGVPSEPLAFRDEGKPRSEDEIIAYSFKKFNDTKDPTWPLLLPMVKSAVKAMDASQDFLKRLSPPVDIKGFVVTGASKRGWTTWLTGAVDPRVVAIAPMVIDVLNMRPQMEHQKACYGGYSEEVKDYTDLGLTDMLGSPESGPLLKIVDPYEYRDKLTMPKLVLVGTSDEYWTVDAATLYFPGLEGEKHIRYEPNGTHGMDRAEGTLHALEAFFNAIVTEKPLPALTWTIDPKGRYTVVSPVPPVEARLWRAHSQVRDFRKVTIGEAWTSELLAPQADGSFRGRVRAPSDGYDAFFVELRYASGLGFDYTLSTLTCVPVRSFPFATVLALGLPLLLVGGLVAWAVFR